MNVSLIIFFAVMIVGSIVLSIIALAKAVKETKNCQCPTTSPAAGMMSNYFGELSISADTQITVGDTTHTIGEWLTMAPSGTDFEKRLSTLEQSTLKNHDTVFLVNQDGDVIYGNSLSSNNRPGPKSVLRIDRS
jgi:hypothetical protein